MSSRKRLGTGVHTVPSGAFVYGIRELPVRPSMAIEEHLRTVLHSASDKYALECSRDDLLQRIESGQGRNFMAKPSLLRPGIPRPSPLQPANLRAQDL
eukprot:499264-Pelagomonas_calceolata.AAC.4